MEGDVEVVETDPTCRYQRVLTAHVHIIPLCTLSPGGKDLHKQQTSFHTMAVAHDVFLPQTSTLCPLFRHPGHIHSRSIQSLWCTHTSLNDSIGSCSAPVRSKMSTRLLTQNLAEKWPGIRFVEVASLAHNCRHVAAHECLGAAGSC
jgi:hypothetical protein